MSFDTEFSAKPHAGNELPLTRRQLRERERAAENSVEQPVPTVELVALPTRRSLRTQVPSSVSVLAEVPITSAIPVISAVSASPVVQAVPAVPVVPAVLVVPTAPAVSVVPSAPVIPATVADAPRERGSHGSTVKSTRVPVPAAPLAQSGPPRRRSKAFASKAFSCVAMLFAGAILVGLSVPSNAFLPSGDFAAAATPELEAAKLSADTRGTQSLAVSDDVVNDVSRQDSIKVISYADVLALQYAGMSYEYLATAGAIRWPFPISIPITDGFGDRAGGFHKGTDFAARSGTPIYAIADGVVSYVASDSSGYGYNVFITHVIDGQKIETHYAHMITDSSPLVVGEPVRVGDFVGLVGDTGKSFGAHLHLEILLDGVPIDPYAWLTTNAIN